jgi:hypothetical protein
MSPSFNSAGASTEGVPATAEELFKETEPYMAHVGHVDYSREAIYSRKCDE